MAKQETPEKISETIKKLYERTKLDVGSERENAKRLLKQLLKKNGLTIEDLLSEEKTAYVIGYKSKNEELLFSQIIMVNLKLRTIKLNRKKKVLYFEATKEQKLDISNEINFYGKILKEMRIELLKQIKTLGKAMINKYEIVGDDDDNDEKKESPKMSRDELLRLMKLMGEMPDEGYTKEKLLLTA